MTKAESKVIDFIKKHILLFLLVAVTIIAIFAVIGLVMGKIKLS